jgi:hypothetical protein
VIDMRDDRKVAYLGEVSHLHAPLAPSDARVSLNIA